MSRDVSLSALLNLLSAYGAHISPAGTDAESGANGSVVEASRTWWVSGVHDRETRPPVRLGPLEEQDLLTFVERFHRQHHGSGDPLELAAMSFLEGIESIDVDGAPILSAIYLARQRDGSVEQVWERRDAGHPRVDSLGDPDDFVWQADPGR